MEHLSDEISNGIAQGKSQGKPQSVVQLEGGNVRDNSIVLQIYR